MNLWHLLVESGFLTNGPVRSALEVGTVSALVSAEVGVYVVVRRQSFAGHALGDVATSGGAGAYYFGASALAGFVVGALVGAAATNALGVARSARRDVATGIVLGAASGLSALFFYLDATHSAASGAAQQVLFGSLFSLSPSLLPVVGGAGASCAAVLIAIHRPLLLTSLSPELADARGVPRRAVGLIFLLTVALSVALACVTIGSILATALLIGPPASALRLTRSPRGALVLAGLIAVAVTWLGVLLAYDSFYWGAVSPGLPVSFFVVVLIFLTYVVAGVGSRRSSAPRWVGRST